MEDIIFTWIQSLKLKKDDLHITELNFKYYISDQLPYSLGGIGYKITQYCFNTIDWNLMYQRWYESN